MHTYSDVFDQWHRVTSADTRGRHLLDGRMWQKKDKITCVSERRVLVETLRNKDGSIRTFLLNGDRGDRYFANQQTALRNILQNRARRDRERAGNGRFVGSSKSPDPIILPFSALRAAGIDRSTIVPIEITQDRWIERRRNYPSFGESDITWRHEGRPESWGYARHGRVKDSPLVVHQGWDSGRNQWRDPWIQDRVRGGQVTFRRSNNRWRDVHQIERTHVLGDSVFRARAHGAWRVFVSSFDYNEPEPLYYLAEIPWNERGTVTTVAEAVVALAPPIVKAAWEQKREVKRQGDMFAIPTKLKTADVQKRAEGAMRKNQGVFGTDHVVDDCYVASNGTTYARGTMRHRPQGRPPDHIPLLLGKDWHLVVPNAVPRRRAGAMVRG